MIGVGCRCSQPAGWRRFASGGQISLRVHRVGVDIDAEFSCVGCDARVHRLRQGDEGLEANGVSVEGSQRMLGFGISMSWHRERRRGGRRLAAKHWNGSGLVRT